MTATAIIASQERAEQVRRDKATRDERIRRAVAANPEMSWTQLGQRFGCSHEIVGRAVRKVAT